MKKPNFKIYIKPIEKELEVIYSFVLERKNNKWILEYFNIDYNVFYSKNLEDRKEFLKKFVYKKYKEEKKQFDFKIYKINEKLNENLDLILNEFANIFNICYDGEEIYKVEMGISPMCPRYLDEKSFDINVLSNINYNFQIILHEMVHFYWFKKLKSLYPNIERREFERPRLSWLLSEIVVDPILKNTGLSKFIVNNPAYEIFYESEINGQNLIEKFNDIYKNSNNIEGFIKESMEFVMLNKTFFENLAKNC